MNIYIKRRIVHKIAAIGILCGITITGICTKIANADNSIAANSYSKQEYKNLSGWQLENSKWYYYKNNERVTGWLNLNGIWYYLKQDGVMAENEWVNSKGIWYYLKQDGVMAENEWINSKGIWYYLKQDGVMAENEWINLKGVWYYLKQDGVMAENELLQVNGIWYKFESNGAMNNKNIYTVGKVKPCDFLNIRSGPGTSNSIVGKIYTNNHVEILEQNSNGWYKIQTENNIVGWVSSKYITILYSESTNASTNETINKVIELAYKQLGKPYKWGAEGPNAFDCSGLTYYVYKNAAGITLPRVSSEQAKTGTYIDRSELHPGDLVCFSSSGTRINHVGIYIGDNKFIHSPQTGDVVKISSIASGYHSRKFVAGRRIIK